MKNFKKGYDLKIISITVVTIFLLNSTIYGIGISDDICLRAPVGQKNLFNRIVDMEYIEQFFALIPDNENGEESTDKEEAIKRYMEKFALLDINRQIDIIEVLNKETAGRRVYLNYLNSLKQIRDENAEDAIKRGGCKYIELRRKDGELLIVFEDTNNRTFILPLKDLTSDKVKESIGFYEQRQDSLRIKKNGIQSLTLAEINMDLKATYIHETIGEIKVISVNLEEDSLAYIPFDTWIPTESYLTMMRLWEGRRPIYQSRATHTLLNFSKMNRWIVKPGTPDFEKAIQSRAERELNKAYVALIFGLDELHRRITQNNILPEPYNDILNKVYSPNKTPKQKIQIIFDHHLYSQARRLFVNIFKETGEDLIKIGAMKSGYKLHPPSSNLGSYMYAPPDVIAYYCNSYSKDGLKYIWMSEPEYNRFSTDIKSATEYYSTTNPEHENDWFSNAILKLKSNPHNQELADEIVLKYADKLNDLIDIESVDIILPVPSDNMKSNQVVPLVKSIGKYFSKQVDLTALEQIKEKEKQVSRNNRQDRLNNVKDIFQGTEEKLKGKTVLIVDDIATTGATLFEAQKAAYEAGARKVFIFSFGKTGGSIQEILPHPYPSFISANSMRATENNLKVILENLKDSSDGARAAIFEALRKNKNIFTQEKLLELIKEDNTLVADPIIFETILKRLGDKNDKIRSIVLKTMIGFLEKYKTLATEPNLKILFDILGDIEYKYQVHASVLEAIPYFIKANNALATDSNFEAILEKVAHAPDGLVRHSALEAIPYFIEANSALATIDSLQVVLGRIDDINVLARASVLKTMPCFLNADKRIFDTTNFEVVLKMLGSPRSEVYSLALQVISFFIEADSRFIAMGEEYISASKNIKQSHRERKLDDFRRAYYLSSANFSLLSRNHSISGEDFPADNTQFEAEGTLYVIKTLDTSDLNKVLEKDIEAGDHTFTLLGSRGSIGLAKYLESNPEILKDAIARSEAFHKGPLKSNITIILADRYDYLAGDDIANNVIILNASTFLDMMEQSTDLDYVNELLTAVISEELAHERGASNDITTERRLDIQGANVTVDNISDVAGFIRFLERHAIDAGYLLQLSKLNTNKLDLSEENYYIHRFFNSSLSRREKIKIVLELAHVGGQASYDAIKGTIDALKHPNSRFGRACQFTLKVIANRIGMPGSEKERREADGDYYNEDYDARDKDLPGKAEDVDYDIDLELGLSYVSSDRIFATQL